MPSVAINAPIRRSPTKSMPSVQRESVLRQPFEIAAKSLTFVDSRHAWVVAIGTTAHYEHALLRLQRHLRLVAPTSTCGDDAMPLDTFLR